jgi:hypothetical protein
MAVASLGVVSLSVDESLRTIYLYSLFIFINYIHILSQLKVYF